MSYKYSILILKKLINYPFEILGFVLATYYISHSNRFDGIFE